jgi:aminocarboxymuconate-semialdehyde decarboxylase
MFSYWAKPLDTLDLARYLNDHIAQTVAEDPKKYVGTVFYYRQNFFINIFH